MKKKISSDFTIIFQIAGLINISTIALILIGFLMFSSDSKTTLICMVFLIIALLVARGIGLLKLKKVFFDEDFIFLKNKNEFIKIPFTKVRSVNKTFLFDDFPYVIKLIEYEGIKKLYFLPKGGFLQTFFGENQLIFELKKRIK